ncbi:MAG TPA: DivIVA domain-containing protein [Acidimicrobiales bacterium]|nr:DivIVA domain-containing protein [Acidimicrobiales bacterium]
MSPEPPLDATGIARRHFSTVRKGYDPDEVRAFLHELADMVGRLQRGEAHERERAERAETRADLAEKLDQHRLIELLGEETARVLDAAREAGGDIRTKAEENAARMVREAQTEARGIIDAADQDAATRRLEILAEADQLRREAEAEVDLRRAEGRDLVDVMRRDAEAERETMLADGERARAEAEATAEQIRAAAREQGRRLVGEAQTVRERMLGDLARRRRTAREQLERLNAARERLLAAYEVVKRTVDEATSELTVALPEAKLASEVAMRRVSEEPEETVEVLEAELSVARMTGLVDDVATAEVSDDELDEMLRELGEEDADDAIPPADLSAPVLAEPGEPAEPIDAADAVEAVDAIPPAPALDEPVESIEATEPAEPESSSPDGHPEAEPDRRPAEARDEAIPAAFHAAVEPSDPEPGGEESEGGQDGPLVDELFARIRAGRPAPGRGAASAPQAAPLQSIVVADPEDEVDASAADEEPEEPEVPEDPEVVVLREREAVLATVERELGRRLKRVLADEQNEVLDLLRRGRSVTFADVVPAGDEHADRFAIAAGPELDAAAAHGAARVGADVAVSCDDLAGSLGRTLVDPLRQRIERSFEDCDGDLEEVGERLRALYREWKGEHIGAAVRHYTAAAYAWGMYEGTPEGAKLRWLVDRTGEPCPDADDNALAGPVAKGSPFPTGDRCSPAHPGCRCLVVPADLVDQS